VLGDAPFDGGSQVLPQVEPGGDLDGVGCAGTGAIGIGAERSRQTTSAPGCAADPDGSPGHHFNFVHCPSEITSMEPLTTVMAVCSSMA
jgi:hypothetical protein